MTDSMVPRVADEDADALSAAWDVLTRGEEPPADANALIDTARRMHALDTTPALATDERARIWQTVLAGNTASTPSVAPRPSANGRHAEPVPRAAVPAARPLLVVVARPKPRFEWAVAHLATAALVLVTIGIAYVTLGPGRVTPRPGSSVPNVVEAPLSLPSGVTERTLVEVAVPAAYLPPWAVATSGFAHVAIPPRSSSTWTTPALRLEYALTGGYSVRSDGPSQVIRQGTSQPEDIAAGATITMAPGDALLAPVATQSTYTNDGQTAAELLSWIVFDDTGLSAPAPPTWTDYNLVESRDLRMVATALTVRLQRFALEPGAAWTTSDDSLRLAIPADREYNLARSKEHTWKNVSNEPSAIFVADVTAAGTGSLMP